MPEDTLELEKGASPGWKAKMKGRDPFPYMVILIMLGVIVYLAVFSLKLWGEPFQLKHAMQEHHIEMAGQHTNYINGVAELTYVMSVCLNQSRQKDCERLHINMPESLYRKLNNAQQP